MAAELQRYQWTMMGMRPDESVLGAMWYYRGMDTDLELMRLTSDLTARDELLRWCAHWNGDPLTLKETVLKYLGEFGE
ncbi:hypothetical protein LCGC14_1031640 [marine sediment metagenome]|uniref:Uncharacterized protein n=1 Tax=marine sediment metagenome TaxID=412755 RepID=A0A0F9MUE6_9ZZZZ